VALSEEEKMAATGYTPISLYYSTTASTAPIAGNLVAGELALNTLDEKLYFKNSSGVVKLLASNTSSSATVSSVAQSFTGGIISVGGSPITTSGTLALTVAGTSGGIPYFSSATTWATSAALAANAIVLGGGAGVAPATTTTGTNVVTALGVNIGTAGAFVVNGGVLGTPSSGTVTNLTGTASININGTVGATTASTGAFTTLTATTSIAINSVAVPTISSTSTLTNKWLQPRVLASTANSATPTLNTDNYDMMVITGQSVAITSFSTNLTGTPVNGQKLIISITGTGAIAITWGASFESSTAALPSTTVTTNRLDVGFIWNVATSKWRCVASA
jgi:hypothetical protein